MDADSAGLCDLWFRSCAEGRLHFSGSCLKDAGLFMKQLAKSHTLLQERVSVLLDPLCKGFSLVLAHTAGTKHCSSTAV